MKPAALAALHLIGSAIFLIFMISRTAQAVTLVEGHTPHAAEAPCIIVERLAPSTPDQN